jgi:putative ABC transport system permease protein
MFYRDFQERTGQPMILSPGRASLVLGLTVVMCMLSAFLSVRKLRTADPAEVF